MEKENELLESFQEALKDLETSSSYQNLMAIRDKLKDNEEILELVKETKRLQQELVRLEAKGHPIDAKEEELKSITDKLFAIPIYSEYYYLNEEIQLDLDMISKTIESEINKIVND